MRGKELEKRAATFSFPFVTTPMTNLSSTGSPLLIVPPQLPTSSSLLILTGMNAISWGIG